MKKVVLTYLIVLAVNIVFAQNFTGQWKGSFVDNSAVVSWGSNKCEYVVDLDIKGNEITGYSYTYYNEDGKKYYTICTLEGTYDRKKKYIEIFETARTKTNVPYNVVNSFQLHKLKWRREAGKEILEGSWLPAPGQKNKNSGFGNTILTKRALTKIYPLAKKNTQASSPFVIEKKNVSAAIKPAQQSLIAKKNTQKQVEKTSIKPAVKTPPKQTSKTLAGGNATIIKKDTETKEILTNKIISPINKSLVTGFEKRDNNILQTVNIENAKVSIELYDNGEVDGDSISLFYNGKVLLAHKKLTSKPITIEVDVNNDETNELVMYADNLGTIPPNTALMIVMDGKKRYEVRVTSDLKKSGTIRFIHTRKSE
jgi:hypothetical protein